MALTPIEIYKTILPKTNCGDCGHPTCIAFATLVVIEKYPLKKCIHLEQSVVDKYQLELEEQYKTGKWVKKDIAADALEWARERAASMKIKDLPDRIGGTLLREGDEDCLELPYFSGSIVIKEDDIHKKDGSELNRWEKVFLYNHLSQGGSREPTGDWKAFVEFPNTVSKIKSMIEHVEEPLVRCFSGKVDALRKRGELFGGTEITTKKDSADITLLFRPLPKIPVRLLFWDAEEDYEGRAKLHFDSTILEHLDIESIMFLSERLRQLLCDEDD